MLKSSSIFYLSLACFSIFILLLQLPLLHHLWLTKVVKESSFHSSSAINAGGGSLYFWSLKLRTWAWINRKDDWHQGKSVSVYHNEKFIKLQRLAKVKSRRACDGLNEISKVCWKISSCWNRFTLLRKFVEKCCKSWLIF